MNQPDPPPRRPRQALRLVFFTFTMALAILLSFGLGVLVASRQFAPVTGLILGPSPSQQELSVVEEAWHVLEQEFVNPDAVEPRRLKQGAIQGMVESLRDPHTAYIDSAHYDLERSSFEGSFDGIGAQVTITDTQLTIVAPLADGPAEAAGIRPGDKIVAVDGEPTDDWNLIQAVQRIRGDRGTKVRLTIERDGVEPFDVEIVRAEIKTDTVSWKMLPDDMAHLRISQFSQRTNEEVKAALQDILDAGAKSIILDLRNNPGGLLEVTVEVASQFLSDGVVLYQVDGEGNREVWNVRPNGLAPDIPLVVLVNRGSASGSEVLAGALQDHVRAALIGEKTFGKGSVNHIRQLSDGSALYVTFARWYTPKERLIEGQGLEPDINVERSEEDIKAGRDPQLDRAIEYLKTGK